MFRLCHCQPCLSYKQNKNSTYITMYTVHNTLCTTQTRVEYTWIKWLNKQTTNSKHYCWRYLKIVYMFWVYNSVSHGMLLSNSVKVNDKTIKILCKGFLSSFEFLPEVYLWFRLCQYHYSNKQTVKCTCITL